VRGPPQGRLAGKADSLRRTGRTGRLGNLTTPKCVQKLQMFGGAKAKDCAGLDQPTDIAQCTAALEPTSTCRGPNPVEKRMI